MACKHDFRSKKSQKYYFESKGHANMIFLHSHLNLIYNLNVFNSISTKFIKISLKFIFTETTCKHDFNAKSHRNVNSSQIEVPIQMSLEVTTQSLIHSNFHKFFNIPYSKN